MIKRFETILLSLLVCIAICSCTGSGVVASDNMNNSSPNATMQGSASTPSANAQTGAASTSNSNSATEIKVNSGTAVKSATIINK